MPVTVEVVENIPAMTVAEGPHWDHSQQALFFVGIPHQTIHKYVPATCAHTSTKLPKGVSFIIPVEGSSDRFIISQDSSFVIVRWDGADGSAAKMERELASVEVDEPRTHLNDGKIDPRGRVFSGTMRTDVNGTYILNHSHIYRLERTKPGSFTATNVDSNISMSNGIAWDPKEKACYYIDTMEKKIRRYDYDVETGAISNMRYIFDLPANKVGGLADGMTIDADGNLWVALFGGYGIIKVDPRSGKLLQKVDFPTAEVTSCNFGGPNLEDLYATTARFDYEDIPHGPLSGRTFVVKGLGVKGVRNPTFKLD